MMLAQVQINILDKLQGAGSPVKIFDLGHFISVIANTILLVAAAATFLYLVYGGLRWVLSSGDKGKAEEARNIITQAIIGLTVTASAFAIFALIQYFFGFNILSGFGKSSSNSSNSVQTSSGLELEEGGDENVEAENIPSGACSHYPNEGYTLSGKYACYDTGLENCVICADGLFYKQGDNRIPRNIKFNIYSCPQECGVSTTSPTIPTKKTQ